jgi:hypothetical protein
MTYEEIKAQEESERSVAQHYSLLPDKELKSFIKSLPENVARQCIRFGSIVSWMLLPKEAQQAYISKRVAESSASD